MYCHNCGKQIPDNSTFCTLCGAPQHQAQTAQEKHWSTPDEPVQGVPKEPVYKAPSEPGQNTPTQAAPKKKGYKVAGIILLVIGIFAVDGGISSGRYIQMWTPGPDVADLVSLGVALSMIFGGIFMIFKAKKD